MSERGDVTFEDPFISLKHKMVKKMRRKLGELKFSASHLASWKQMDLDTHETIDHHLEIILEALKRGYPDCP